MEATQAALKDTLSREAKDEEVKNELIRLATHQCPPSFGGSDLREIAKRLVRGEDISRHLNDYIRQNFCLETKTKGVSRPPKPKRPESRRQRRRREYARTQELLRKNQARCIHEILDGKGDHPPPEAESFLSVWQNLMERRSTASVEVVRPACQPTDPFVVISSREICSASPPKEYCSRARWHHWSPSTKGSSDDTPSFDEYLCHHEAHPTLPPAG